MGEKLITFVFVVENCKDIIDVSVIRKRVVDSLEKQSFVISDKNVGERWAKGEPIATPSICRCVILLKLSSTEEVAVCIRSTKTARGKGGGVSSPLCRASAQISMVSANGTLAKRLQTS